MQQISAKATFVCRVIIVHRIVAKKGSILFARTTNPPVYDEFRVYLIPSTIVNLQASALDDNHPTQSFNTA
jgi:hypothetical protein